MSGVETGLALRAGTATVGVGEAIPFGFEVHTRDSTTIAASHSALTDDLHSAASGSLTWTRTTAT